MAAAPKLLLLCLVLCLPLAGLALDERQDLAEQRQRIEARHAEALKACVPRFNVNACEQQARSERSTALKPVLAREQALSAEQREARSQAQRERVQAKQQAFASDDGQRMQRSVLGDAVAAVAASAPVAGPKPSRIDEQAHGRAVQAEVSRGERTAERNRRQAALREQQAQARRESAQRHLQESAGKTGSKPVTRLPVPSLAEIEALPARPASAATP